MQAARAPYPLRGLAIALILGVVLAVAAVGVLASVPTNFSLTGASLGAPAANSSKSNQSGQASTTLTPTNNATSGVNSMATTNSTLDNVVNVNQFVAAISGGQTAGASNSTPSAGLYGNYSGASVPAGQDRSATVAAGARDLIIFAVAGVLAFAAFMLSRRQIS
jgi:hypothetical protein